jgi:intraflagellar transport protein 81
MDLESEYNERKNHYDKIAVQLDFEKQTLDKECDEFQEECLREESRFHYLNALISTSRIKLERAEAEKKYQSGHDQLMRDFRSYQDLYSHKLTQQDQLTKQLRRRQKELKESSEAMTNQKSNFLALQALMNAKLNSNGSMNGEGKTDSPAKGYAESVSFGGANVMSMDFK